MFFSQVINIRKTSYCAFDLLKIVAHYNHIVAVGGQCAKNHVFLSHQIDLFQVGPFDRGKEGADLESGLEDAGLPEIFALPAI